MEDGQNDDALVICHEEDFVWKSAREGSTHDSVDERELLGVAVNSTEYGIHTAQEVSPQAGNSIFIPVKGACHLRLGFGADDKPADHLLLLIRSRTIPQGDPSSGF